LRDYKSSNYCIKRNVKESFEEIIKNAEFRYIFLSYNNEGLMNIKEIKVIMEKYGKYGVMKQKYRRLRQTRLKTEVISQNILMNFYIF